jgi:membrane-associated phospholipid phosphatase
MSTHPFLTMLLFFQITSIKWARVPTVAFYFLMCLSAVYLQHHYVVDILLGTTYALAVYLIFGFVLGRRDADQKPC